MLLTLSFYLFDILQGLLSTEFSLQREALQLNRSSCVRTAVSQIVDRTLSCVQDFTKTLLNEGRCVLVLASTLVNLVNIDEVDFKKSTHTLESLSVGITRIKNNIAGLDKEVNSNIEVSRSKKVDHEKELVHIRVQVEIFAQKIKQIERDIDTCEDRRQTFETAASELQSRAIDIDRAEANHNTWGIVSVVAAVAGILLAPITGKYNLLICNPTLNTI